MGDAGHALERLLEDERKLLLAGKMRELEAVAQEKRKLFDNLDVGLSKPQLDILRQKSKINHRLYRSALEGLKAASARIAAVREAQNGFATYTRDGQSAQLIVNRAARSTTA